MAEQKDDILLFYAIRNNKGQWFHRKGYGGSGESWTNSLRGARIYNKIGYARAQVRFFSEHYPSYPVPDIVIFKVVETEVINEADLLKKKKEKELKKAGIQRLERARKDKEKADREFQEAQAALNA